MSAPVVDLARVRGALARLDAAVAAHPGLTSPEAQGRLAAAMASETGETVLYELGREVLSIPGDARVRLDTGAECAARDADPEAFAWRLSVEVRPFPSGTTINTVDTPIGYRLALR